MNNEDELEPAPVAPAPLNLAKATTSELKKTPITTTNADSVTRELVKRDKMVMLKIQSTERDKHAVFVGINGRNWNIPRDTWVKVPSCVVATLEEAKITQYAVMADPKQKDHAEIESNEVSRFGMSTKPVDEPAEPITVPATTKVK